MTPKLRFLSFGLLILFGLAGSCAHRKDRIPSSVTSQSLSAIVGDGTPQRLGKDLPPESYVAFETQQLKNAKVLWVNFEALRELGIEFPATGLTPEFERLILDHFAYMVPQPEDNPGDYTPKKKTFYADRYGGHGIGNNGGSARAASTGGLQVKNIGQTPLRGPQIAFDHSHGGGSIKEAVQEAVWGEVANEELPHKANRVLFILDTGTYTHWPDGSKERRSLIVRQDPLRPAHFIPAYFYKVPTGQADESLRTQEAIRKLFHDPTAPRLVRAQIEEIYDRMVDQVATARAKRIFHGALSVSNIEISGRYMDYASVTSTSGYVDHQADHPSIKSFSHEIDRIKSNFEELSLSLHQHSNLGQALPSQQEMNQFIEDRFQVHRRRAFLEQLGFNALWVQRTHSNPEALQLMSALDKLMARDSQTRVLHQDDLSKVKVHARLDDLVRIALSEPQAPTHLTSRKLATELEIPETDAMELTQTLRAYFHRVSQLAASENIAPPQLLKAILLSSQIKNQNMLGLYRENFKRNVISQVDAYLQNQNRSQLWDYVDQVINSNRRSFASASPHFVVLSEQRDAISGLRTQVIYDPVDGALKRVEIQTGPQQMYSTRTRPLTSLEIQEFEKKMVHISGFGAPASSCHRCFSDLVHGNP